MAETAICNLAIIGLTAIFSYNGFVRPGFQNHFIFCPEFILRDRQYYRLVTSGLLHADWMHLLFNMYSLYSFGSSIELFFGPLTFMTIYLSGIIGGNLLSLYLHRHHDYLALGASGGVCGVIFAGIFLLPGTGVQLFLVPITIPAHVFAIVFVLVSYYGIRSQRGNIGHDAHLGGAVVGLLAATGLHPHIISRNPVLYPLVLGVSTVLFVYLYRSGLDKRRRGRIGLAGLKDLMYGRQQRRAGRRQARDEQIEERLLDKVSKSGLGSLTERDKEQLKEISERRRGRI